MRAPGAAAAAQRRARATAGGPGARLRPAAQRTGGHSPEYGTGVALLTANRGRARDRRAPTERPAACAARARCGGLGRCTLSNGTCWATPAGFWPSQMAAGRLQRRLHGCGAMAPRGGRRAGSRLATAARAIAAGESKDSKRQLAGDQCNAAARRTALTACTSRSECARRRDSRCALGAGVNYTPSYAPRATWRRTPTSVRRLPVLDCSCSHA